MRIKKLVLYAIKGHPELRKQLCEALDVSDPTLRRLIRENDDQLTKASALLVIRKEFGVEDSEILEEELSTAKTA